MARMTGPSCRQCRREGMKLYIKGERCYSGKCAVTRRPTAPGQHGAGKKKVEEYGRQLREKQRAKRYYGVMEKQFENYFAKAVKQKGMTGDNLFSLLERRLDNTVYRMGMSENRRDARQLVLHAYFTVNGKKVNIPSMLLKAGDEIAISEIRRDRQRVKNVSEGLQTKNVPKWLDVDKDNMTAKVLMLPTREDVDFPFEEHLIVELYSK